jgi:hypothetical protein
VSSYYDISPRQAEVLVYVAENGPCSINQVHTRLKRLAYANAYATIHKLAGFELLKEMRDVKTDMRQVAWAFDKDQFNRIMWAKGWVATDLGVVVALGGGARSEMVLQNHLSKFGFVPPQIGAVCRLHHERGGGPWPSAEELIFELAGSRDSFEILTGALEDVRRDRSRLSPGRRAPAFRQSASGVTRSRRIPRVPTK